MNIMDNEINTIAKCIFKNKQHYGYHNGLNHYGDINLPYCAEYNSNNYYLLNRNYKNLGNGEANFIEYPELEGKVSRLYFYENRPWKTEKEIKQYLIKLSHFRREMEKRSITNIIF